MKEHKHLAITLSNDKNLIALLNLAKTKHNHNVRVSCLPPYKPLYINGAMKHKQTTLLVTAFPVPRGVLQSLLSSLAVLVRDSPPSLSLPWWRGPRLALAKGWRDVACAPFPLLPSAAGFCLAFPFLLSCVAFRRDLCLALRAFAPGR